MRRKLLGARSAPSRRAERGGRGEQLGRRPPAGRGRGVALHESFGSIVAEVAEVSVEGGNVRVHKVWCAIDCGFAANPPASSRRWKAPSTTDSRAALHGEITFDDGKVEQSNFHDYQILRINEAPEIFVTIVNSGEPMGGAGEPGTPPIAPAVANAIYRRHGQARAAAADRQEPGVDPVL